MNVCVCVRGVRSVNLYGEIDVLRSYNFEGTFQVIQKIEIYT